MWSHKFRLRGRRFLTPHLGTGPFDSLDNVVIAGTSTKIAGYPPPDLILCRIVVVLQQLGHGKHTLPTLPGVCVSTGENNGEDAWSPTKSLTFFMRTFFKLSSTKNGQKFTLLTRFLTVFCEVPLSTRVTKNSSKIFSSVLYNCILFYGAF